MEKSQAASGFQRHRHAEPMATTGNACLGVWVMQTIRSLEHTLREGSPAIERNAAKAPKSSLKDSSRGIGGVLACIYFASTNIIINNKNMAQNDDFFRHRGAERGFVYWHLAFGGQRSAVKMWLDGLTVKEFQNLKLKTSNTLTPVQRLSFHRVLALKMISRKGAKPQLVLRGSAALRETFL
jgi:hypothetical protein